MVDPGSDAVEQQIREAQARGDFDNLPGAGKPLNLRNLGDPEWWVKGLIDREKLDMTGVLPAAVQLRKEAEGFPESLVDVSNEETVRTILEDFNRRVKYDRLRALDGSVPQVVAPTVDVDAMVTRWSELRRQRRRAASTETQPEPERPSRRSWWRPRRRSG